MVGQRRRQVEPLLQHQQVGLHAAQTDDGRLQLMAAHRVDGVRIHVLSLLTAAIRSASLIDRSFTRPSLMQTRVGFGFHPFRGLTVVFLIAVLGAAAAGLARADLLTGDPRVCSLNKPAQCAQTAAKYTLVRYMRTHGHPTWSNPTNCTQTAPSSLLKWRCQFGTGSAAVWFRATATGWKRVVTVTMNP